MTVGKLKELLEGYDDEDKIVFQPNESPYGEYIDDIEEDKGIAPLRGDDYKALILKSGGQCGEILDVDELEL